MSALAVRALRKSFGGLRVTTNVNLAVEPGERRLVIGPNGAGKTTLFNIISGFNTPTTGQVFFGDDDITAIAPELIAERGLVRT